MKSIFTILTGIVLSATASAQFSFGIQGTGNLSDAAINKEEGFDINKKMRAMPGGGIVVVYQVGQHVALRSGVNYLQHGIRFDMEGIYQWEGQDIAYKAIAKSNLNYIQVPVNILYTTGGSAVQFFAGGGPFVNYGISGKTKLETTYKAPGEDPFTEKEESDAFKKESDGGSGFSRTDFGVGAIAGIKIWNGFFVNAGYQFSLSNINSNEDGKYKNRGLQVTIGKMF